MGRRKPYQGQAPQADALLISPILAFPRLDPVRPRAHSAPMKPELFVLQHPLADDSLRVLRDKDTTPARFRQSIRRLTTLLLAEATRQLSTEEVVVQTPMMAAPGKRLDCRVGLIPILRAGLAMVEPVLDLLPDAEVWHLGFYRDETTLQPVPYYEKLAPDAPVDVALVLDPMLATGGSACAALQVLRDWGVKQTMFLGLIAAPEGVARLREEFPETATFVCALDLRLNEKGYILPGLGDAGNRAFNANAR